mmetsp:Transcript_95871/g.169424  ORF Transcript_95871/g.169424 Transcript_95871/m.169424 type:complete len:108 (-) Transcript_95871:17-340(-)
MVLNQKGGWCWYTNVDNPERSIFSVNGSDIHTDKYPKFKTGMVIGVDVDMTRGSLSFWADQQFLGVSATHLKGKTLFPAFSITRDTIMHVKTGLHPPDLVGSLQDHI